MVAAALRVVFLIPAIPLRDCCPDGLQARTRGAGQTIIPGEAPLSESRLQSEARHYPGKTGPGERHEAHLGGAIVAAAAITAILFHQAFGQSAPRR